MTIKGRPSLWALPKTLNVSYHGRRVFMKDSATGFNVVTAMLDDCGRPVSATFSDFTHTIPFPPPAPLVTRYEYDRRGRLARFFTGYENYDTDTCMVTYDQHGNVLYFGSDQGNNVAFEYYYDKPAGKAAVYSEIRSLHWGATDFLTIAGHINLIPRHLRKMSVSRSGNTLIDRNYYADFQFEGNQVTAYNVRKGGVDGTLYESYAIGWSCRRSPVYGPKH